MASLSDRSLRMKISVLAVASLLILLGILYAVFGPEEKKADRYSPVVELPADFAVIVDHPQSIEDQMAAACLTPVLFQGGGYHPLIILDEDNSLPRQVIYTLTHLKRDYTKILFTNSEGRTSALNGQLSGASLSQIEEENVFPLTADICSGFIGFDDIITVSSYEEALWAAPIARHDNMALVKGEPTFISQEHAWSEMLLRKIPADYIIATNPHDHDLGTLKNNTPDYDDYDDPWFCPDLSLAAAELAAYHNAYVITNTTPTDTVDWNLNMEFSPNRRAAGILNEIRELDSQFGPASYVTIVGSASSMPQFLTQIDGKGAITNSDIMYGFLDVDHHTMDAAVGRIIQYDIDLACNQLLKTFLFEDFEETVHVDYRDVAGGPQEKEWRRHGASFSGFDITYKRMQATPGRWICKDFEDAGFTYDYVGPFGTGNKFADGVVNSMENNIVEICRGSGYVAYRGHGSDYGSLYGIRVYGPNGEEHQLRAEETARMDVPPQIAFFVSCLNGKIYGHGPGTDPSDDVDFERLFTLNYLSSGPAVLIGATEVSYSNIGQDLTTLPAEYLPFSDDHQWDHNDAWYAFVWDGILNHPDEHGTAGKAVQWSENRYIKYPPNNKPTPFEPEDEVDWREVTFFALYGDPAFRPAIALGTQPNYDPWHNGPDDM